MHSGKLILTAIVAATLLLILELTRTIVARQVARRITPQKNFSMQFSSHFMLNLVFVVLLPTVIYAALYPILPFTSYRAGFFIALFIFGVGILPHHLRLQSQFGLSSVLASFDLFWSLLTLLVVIGTITLLYHY